MNDISTQKVRELLERIQELEEKRDTLNEVNDALIEVANRFVKERDVALETLRLERLSQFVNKADVIRAETQRGYADARVLRMVEEMGKARQERDAALERVRVLQTSIKSFLDFRGLISGAEYENVVYALSHAYRGFNEAPNA